MNFLKKNLKDILLVALYTFIAIAVYVCWFHFLWNLWYIDLITALVILVIGCTVGFFYVRAIHKAEKKEEAIQENSVVEEKHE